VLRGKDIPHRFRKATFYTHVHATTFNSLHNPRSGKEFILYFELTCKMRSARFCVPDWSLCSSTARVKTLSSSKIHPHIKRFFDTRPSNIAPHILYPICMIRGAQNPGRLVFVVAKCKVASNICGTSVCCLFHVTLLTSRILKWLLDFWKIYAPLRMINCKIFPVRAIKIFRRCRDGSTTS